MTQWEREPKAKAGIHINSWIPIYKHGDSTQSVADNTGPVCIWSF